MDMLLGLLRNKVLWTATLISVAYWIIAPMFPPQTVLEWTNGIIVLVGIAVFASYAPGIVMKMSQSDKIDRVLQLSIGITISWAATSILRLWGLMWRKSGMPDWMQLNYVVGYLAFLTICAGVLHITAPGAVDGIVPKKNWIIVGIAIALGIGLALYSSVIDFDSFLNLIDDYIRIDTNLLPGSGWELSRIG